MRRALLTALLALAVLPATATASATAVYEDCQDGRMDANHSAKDLRDALSDIPVDLDEYTNCRDIIRSAQQGVRGPGGSGPTQDPSGKGGYGPVIMGEGGLPVGAEKRPFNPRDLAEKDELEEIDSIANGGAGAQLANAAQNVDPAKAGNAPTRTAGADLPGTLVLVLVLAAAALLVPAIARLRSLVVRRDA